ncbi:OX-2 membrane glycoprotein-like [Sparus aurata]|uniref:OX-2 membrane glycoprotein-like n=1 Tax=Sparus aurata TaxID=8175 RepID=UPI0011C1BA01|nr:OX-2 membrane glycoprotein-like [Sparus aurata]
MALRALLLFFYTLGIFQKGLTDVIRTQQTVMAAEGDEVLLNCELMQPKDVVKVTWWKILPKEMKNLISYHKKYGQKVNPDFRDKVKFTDVGLQNSSIFIRNVTEEDEGCYLCLFNIDPGDDLNATTCLQLYELHEPVLHVRESGSEETVVSCSATGRPAPTVTLTVLRDNVHFPGNSSVSVNNTNGTVTVTSTAVLTRLHHMDTEVRCAVRVLSAPQKEEVRMIPAEGFNEDSGIEITWFTIITILSVVLFFCCVAAAVLLIRRHVNSRRQRDSEEIMMSRETTEHKSNGQLSKRSPEKREGSQSPEPSPETCRKLL